MRDKRFVAAHRGGFLSLEDHRGLMVWAIACVNHALLLVSVELSDTRLAEALRLAEEWKNGHIKTGPAMKAAYSAHAAARDTQDPIAKSMARAISQAVSTAHMADHCIGAALYALLAVKLAGKPVEKEATWQRKKLTSLTPDIAVLVTEVLEEKKQGFKGLK